MMEELLHKVNHNVLNMPCCHTDGRQCNCYTCLNKGYYNKEPNTYACGKKMNYYVLNYGPSYASEFYYYLHQSKIIESYYLNNEINILSLGCGFAPDLFAIDKYIKDKGLNVKFRYHGIEISNSWTTARFELPVAQFSMGDVTKKMDFSNYNFVIISKLFSTLKKHGIGDKFLQLFTTSVQNQFLKTGIVVFTDINDYHLGRDEFHNSIVPLFDGCRQYYFNGYTGHNWIQISENDLAFSIPDDLQITPLQKMGKTFFFEYRK